MKFPDPPEGHFWRVAKDGEWGWVEVRLMRRLPDTFWRRNRSETVSYTSTNLNDPPPNALAEEAEWLLRDLGLRRRTADLLGDYPPKELP